MNITIPPEVARHVHFYPADPGDMVDLSRGEAPADRQPMAAQIAYVHGINLVNLTVFDHEGRTHAVTNVLLVQPGNPVPAHDYCRWMDYTIKQATPFSTHAASVPGPSAAQPADVGAASTDQSAPPATPAGSWTQGSSGPAA